MLSLTFTIKFVGRPVSVGTAYKLDFNIRFLSGVFEINWDNIGPNVERFLKRHPENRSKLISECLALIVLLLQIFKQV